MLHLRIHFGERPKLIKFPEKTGQTLFSVVKSAVVVTLKGDHLLSQYVNQPFFLKYYYKGDKVTGYVEFDDFTEFTDIDESYPLEFILQKDVNVTVQCGNDAAGPSNNRPAPNVVLVVDNNSSDLEYLRGIGMDTSNSPELGLDPSKTPPATHASSKRSPAAAVTENKEPQKPSNSLKSRKRKQDDEISPYEAQANLQRQKNMEFFKQNSIVTAKNSILPKVKKRRTPANKKVTTAQVPRSMPHRKAKERRAGNEAEQQDEEEMEVDDIPVQEVAGDQDAAQSLTSANKSAGKTVERKPVRRWAMKKQPNVKGDKITNHMPLSPLPAFLENELQDGILNIRNVNDFIISHCKTIVKRSPRRGEYGVLAEQFCQAMKNLGIVNAFSFLKKIQLSVSSSVRGKKTYPTTVKPRRAAKRQLLALQQNQILQLGEAPSSDNVTNNTQEDNCDARLRRPVVNKDGVKAAIKSSIVRIEFFKTHSVQEIMSTYPYLQHCDLMIFEYCTRVSRLQEDMEKNFDKALAPLASILDKDVGEATNSELTKLQLFQLLDNHFTDDNSTVHPLIQLWDTSVKAISPLNNLPQGQAPAIIVLKSIDAVQSISLTFDGEKLSTLATPTAFQCIALLVAAYYVFDCAYPSAYIDSLSVIEAILHDTIKSSFKSCRGDTCRRRLDFLQKLSTAVIALN